jgi:hypothetical protein
MSLISGITNPKRHKWTKETPNGPDYTQRSLNPKHPNKSNSDKDHKDHVNTPPLVLSNGPDYSQKTKVSSQLSMSRSAYQSSLIENRRNRTKNRSWMSIYRSICTENRWLVNYNVDQAMPCRRRWEGEWGWGIGRGRRGYNHYAPRLKGTGQNDFFDFNTYRSCLDFSTMKYNKFLNSILAKNFKMKAIFLGFFYFKFLI